MILAIGTQGNPNKMRCDGGDLPHIQYQLDDPGEYVDEHIIVIGSGDAGIENALGLAADPAQGNVVSIINRSAEFARAKQANVDLLMEAGAAGRINILCETTPARIVPGFLYIETRDGEQKIKCDRIIARMGSSPPRKFVEECGIQFTSEDRDAYPTLSPQFETTVPGIYVIGALAGYPLIKHCMNQGYDVVEFINGNVELKPADEPILEKKFAGLPGARSRHRMARLPAPPGDRAQRAVDAADARVHARFRAVAPIARARSCSSATIPAPRCSRSPTARSRSRSIPSDPSRTVPIAQGSIVGEVGLISGRKRGATVRTAEGSIVIEIPRNAALKLMATNSAAKREITRIATERHAAADVRPASRPRISRRCSTRAEIQEIRAGQAIINEGEEGYRRLRHPPGLDGGREERSAASRSSSPTFPPAPMSARWR